MGLSVLSGSKALANFFRPVVLFELLAKWKLVHATANAELRGGRKAVPLE